MLFVILITLTLLLLFDNVRRLRKQNLALTYQYRLYALRDELREKVMEGEIHPKNWVFEYLDSSIAKTIGLISEISIWEALAILAVHRNDGRIKKAWENLFRELSKPTNRELNEIYRRYVSTLGEFLLNRHTTLLGLSLLAALPIVAGVRMGKSMKKKWENTIDEVAKLPETSTIYEYCPKSS